MRLQGQKQGGVKIAIQPYPYIKGESKGQNKSLVILEATTEEVHKFIVTAFKELDDKDEQFKICVWGRGVLDWTLAYLLLTQFKRGTRET